MPHLDGRLDGQAMRVPIPNGSVTDLVARLSNTVTGDEVNAAFRDAAATGPLGSVLEYREAPLVSSDIVGSPASCVFDADLTIAMGDTVKVNGWYDNEWGYANRLLDLVLLTAV